MLNLKVPHNDKGKTNILSMFDLVDLGFRVQMDTAVENKIFVEKGGKVRVFKPSKNGLHHCDCEDEKMVHFEKQQKNCQETKKLKKLKRLNIKKIEMKDSGNLCD